PWVKSVISPACQGSDWKTKWSFPASPVMVSGPEPPTRVSSPAVPTRSEPPDEPCRVTPPPAGGGETGGGEVGGGETGGGEAAPKPTKVASLTWLGETPSSVVMKVPN